MAHASPAASPFPGPVGGKQLPKRLTRAMPCSGGSWGKWLLGVLMRGRQRWVKREPGRRAPPCARPRAEIVGSAKNEQDITCGLCALGAGAEQSAGKPCSAAAPTPLPAGTGRRSLAPGDGSIRAEASVSLSGDVLGAAGGSLAVGVALEDQAALRWGCWCGMPWRCWPRGWSLQAMEGVPNQPPVEAFVPQNLNRQVPLM